MQHQGHHPPKPSGQLEDAIAKPCKPSSERQQRVLGWPDVMVLYGSIDLLDMLWCWCCTPSVEHVFSH